MNDVKTKPVNAPLFTLALNLLFRDKYGEQGTYTNSASAHNFVAFSLRFRCSFSLSLLPLLLLIIFYHFTVLAVNLWTRSGNAACKAIHIEFSMVRFLLTLEWSKERMMGRRARFASKSNVAHICWSNRKIGIKNWLWHTVHTQAIVFCTITFHRFHV